jgi:hypothetical protein
VIAEYDHDCVFGDRLEQEVDSLVQPFHTRPVQPLDRPQGSFARVVSPPVELHDRTVALDQPDTCRAPDAGVKGHVQVHEVYPVESWLSLTSASAFAFVPVLVLAFPIVPLETPRGNRSAGANAIDDFLDRGTFSHRKRQKRPRGPLLDVGAVHRGVFAFHSVIPVGIEIRFPLR